MKNFLLLSLACLGVCQVRAQVNPKIDSTVQLVRKYFNEQAVDKIYELVGADFRKSISAEQFAGIAKNKLFPLGQMPVPEYVGTKDGIAQYKIDFTTVPLFLYISLDGADKIQAFLFKPNDKKEQKTTKVATTNTLQTEVDKLVDEATQPYISRAATVGISVGVLKEGKITYYHYGEVEKGKNILPNDHTLYEIGSITKTFTAILLADAVTRGQVKLDDPVNKYLPNSIPQLTFEGVPVTLKNLSNHTSGLPGMPTNFDASTKNANDPYKDYGIEELIAFYKTYKLTKKPGTVYEYSNLAVATLGWILERVTKKTFEQLVKEKILLPMGMKETKQTLTKKDSAHFAMGYNYQGLYNGPWNLKAFAPAGALRSTVVDMMLYAKNILETKPTALSKPILLTQKITFTDDKNKVGLGWHFIKPGNNEVVFHNGGTGGFCSYLAIDKEKKIAVVLLSNTAAGADGVGNNLMKSLE